MLTRSLTGDLSSPKSGLTRGFSLGLKASFPTSPVLRQRSTSLNERNTYPVTGSVKYCKKLLYINQKNATKIEAQRNNQYTTNQTILNTDILVVPYFSFQGGGRLSPPLLRIIYPPLHLRYQYRTTLETMIFINANNQVRYEIRSYFCITDVSQINIISTYNNIRFNKANTWKNPECGKDDVTRGSSKPPK